MAQYLNISPGELKKKFLRRVGFRRSIIEDSNTHDCVFLRQAAQGKTCLIYPVRPSQCRSWPFWPCNLASPYDWNGAAKKCTGINRGSLYNAEQIRDKKSNPKWWRE
jgi:Fe-S-cluster containining protein